MRISEAPVIYTDHSADGDLIWQLPNQDVGHGDRVEHLLQPVLDEIPDR
jgi:hypothetical protein